MSIASGVVGKCQHNIEYSLRGATCRILGQFRSLPAGVVQHTAWDSSGRLTRLVMRYADDSIVVQDRNGYLESFDGPSTLGRKQRILAQL